MDVASRYPQVKIGSQIIHSNCNVATYNPNSCSQFNNFVIT